MIRHIAPIGTLLVVCTAATAQPIDAGDSVRQANRAMTGGGTEPRLTIEFARHARLDGDPGVSRMRVLGPDSAMLVEAEYAGTWYELGYDSVGKRFVVAGAFEMGGWLPIRSLAYVSALDGTMERTGFGADGWYAFAVVLDRNGLRYAAFVGGNVRADSLGLYGWDLRRNACIRLGAAPGPPPIGDNEELARFHREEDGYVWGVPPWDGYCSIEQSVLAFDPATPGMVKASYGADTEARRARKRSPQVWNLTQLFNP